MDFRTNEAYKWYNMRNRLSNSRMESSTSFPGRLFADGARTLVGFFATPANTKTKDPPADALKRVHGATLTEKHPADGKRELCQRTSPSCPWSVQTTRLAIQDLPKGSCLSRLDYKHAFRLACLFSKHIPDMPPKVGPELRGLPVSGAFQHTCDSYEQPIKHQHSKKIFDAANDEPTWINITYDRRFILADVYGVETLRQQCQGIVDAVLTRCGEELDGSLTYRRGPDDSKPEVGVLITQMSETVSKQQKVIDRLEKTVSRLPGDSHQ